MFNYHATLSTEVPRGGSRVDSPSILFRIMVILWIIEYILDINICNKLKGKHPHSRIVITDDGYNFSTMKCRPSTVDVTCSARLCIPIPMRHSKQEI